VKQVVYTLAEESWNLDIL